jgi:hypothetical protein
MNIHTTRVFPTKRNESQAQFVQRNLAKKQVAPTTMKTGTQLIAEERARQISEEGWSAYHDETHIEGQLAYAGASYALYHALKTTFPPASFKKLKLEDQATKEWPWDREWWKPSKDPIRNLAKAGALIAAEIDRLQAHQQR